MKVLFVGDVFGHGGREIACRYIKELIPEYGIDFCIVNGENATNGRGLSLSSCDELLAAGADCITMGNHTWSNPEITSFIDDYPVIRPINYAEGVPGKGAVILEKPCGKLGIINVMGRVYMDPVDNPFTICAQAAEEIRKETPNIFVDMHAEATAEKIALAYYLDGKVSCVAGTHTHVQTADERILPGGTAFITDVGMTGPINGVIGMDKQNVVDKFVRSMPVRFTPDRGEVEFRAILTEIDAASGKSLKIDRINGI